MLIRGKTLDLLILSLLRDQSTPMTGYSIVKAIGKKFHHHITTTPSPGTVYPRLKKLEENGDIQRIKEKSYSITDQGNDLLQNSVKEIVDNAFGSWSIIYKSLLNNMSYPRRFKVLDRFGDFYGFNAETINQCCQFSEDLSTNDLKSSKSYLEKMKKEIEKKSKKLLDDLDKNLKKLDEMIEKKQATLVKPKIEWED
ncbi:MAG: PadR family transcriptional regulator [Promethearchaeota archaeon]